jgi:hypothetical protein
LISYTLFFAVVFDGSSNNIQRWIESLNSDISAGFQSIPLLPGGEGRVEGEREFIYSFIISANRKSMPLVIDREVTIAQLSRRTRSGYALCPWFA